MSRLLVCTTTVYFSKLLLQIPIYAIIVRSPEMEQEAMSAVVKIAAFHCNRALGRRSLPIWTGCLPADRRDGYLPHNTAIIT